MVRGTKTSIENRPRIIQLPLAASIFGRIETNEQNNNQCIVDNKPREL